ncbi:MAG: leucine-rich repeat protein [Acutalibacteraceae bacterium]|nr:leucine-rich repeat protein [Acutalibacteraceae bacterium]
MKKIISALLTATLLLSVTASIPLSASAVTADKVGYTNSFYDGPYTNALGEEIYIDQYGYFYSNGYTKYDDLYLNLYRDENRNAVYIDEYNNHWICEWLDSARYGYRITLLGYGSYGSSGNPKSIEIPAHLGGSYGDPVLEIGDYVFKDLWGLTDVTIPDTVTYIGNGAFENCDMLTNVTIPDSVTDIGNYVFLNCDSLTDINVSPNNKNYSSIDGVVFNKTQTELLLYPCGRSSYSYTIPDSVTSIGDGELYNYDDGAFQFCSNLTSITIPDSVTSIDHNAFYNCYNLSDVYYTGSTEQWNIISIGQYNDYLTNATIHFNYGKAVAGDISGDGTLAVNDVIYLLKNIVGDTELTAEQITLADVNTDGDVTVLDAVLIQKMILEIN